MSDDLICPIPEPEKYDKYFLKKFKIEMESEAHIHWRVVKEHYDNFNSVPKERRQKILDRFRKGGITIGELAIREGLDAKVVGDIIYLNIQSHQYSTLNEETA